MERDGYRRLPAAIAGVVSICLGLLDAQLALSLFDFTVWPLPLPSSAAGWIALVAALAGAHAASLLLSTWARRSTRPGFWYAFAMFGWSVLFAALGGADAPLRDEPPADRPDPPAEADPA